MGKEFPKNIEESKGYTVLILGELQINLQDLIHYCNYIFFPSKDYSEEKRVALHEDLFSQCGKVRLDEKMVGTEFNSKLDSIICKALCCPMHGSLDRNSECFNCDFKIKTKSELFNTIIVNLLNRINKI